MQLFTFSNQDKMHDWIEKWCEDSFKETGAKSIYLPAGLSLSALYQSWRNNPPKYLENIALYPVDDIIEGPQKDVFKKFFLNQLPHYQHQLRWPKKTAHQAELAILGLGRNGHVAFHEPHVPWDFSFGEVQLDKTTCAQLGLKESAKAITYGLGSFLKCKKILLVVSGEGKKEIFQKVLDGDTTLPATQLLKHPQLSIVTAL